MCEIHHTMYTADSTPKHCCKTKRVLILSMSTTPLSVILVNISRRQAKPHAHEKWLSQKVQS
jgi:hypothetical protein